MKKIILISTFSIFLLAETYSQDCDMCIEALKHGTSEQFTIQTQHSLEEAYAVMFSQDFEDWENYANTTIKSSSLNAAYSVYSAKFKSYSNKDEKRNAFTKRKTEYAMSHLINQNDYQSISSSLQSTVVYKTFETCILNNCGGEKFTTTREVNGKDIIVTTRWNLKDNNPNQIRKLTSISMSSNVVSTDGNLIKGVTITPFNSITSVFKRFNVEEDAFITFTFEFTTPQEVKVEGEKQKSSIPIGTIIASVYDYHDFCISNNYKYPTPGENYAKITWAPCDGRSVVGSTYNSETPDLRGVFLRGLNKFDNLNDPIAHKHPEQLDPETRYVKSYQPDSLKSHTHFIKAMIHQADHSNPTFSVGDNGNYGEYPFPIKGGGGEETRPKNVAIFYYIKIN